MTDVTITRGVIWRDDFLSTAAWIAQDNTGGTRAVASLSTDGDIGTFTVVFTAGVANDVGEIYHAGLSISTTTYPYLMIRHAGLVIGNLNAKVKATYGDATVDVFTMGSASGYLVESFTLTPGKTLVQVNIQFFASGNVTGTFVEALDFTMVFKETLTLPAVDQPFDIITPRVIADLPILQREGSIIQDLGSLSSTLTPTGTLSTTTTPNNYTGLQWAQVLQGIALETGGILAATGTAAPVWQWFTSEQISCKVALVNFRYRSMAGRRDYYIFSLVLRKIDVLSATAQTWGAII